jgi:hypothetical protein
VYIWSKALESTCLAHLEYVWQQLFAMFLIKFDFFILFF